MDQDKLEIIRRTLPRIPEKRQNAIAEILANPRKCNHELLNLFLTGNYKIHADNSREELKNMADLAHPELRYGKKEKQYLHGYYWNFRCEINNDDGSVKVTITELKISSDRYKVQKTLVYPKTSIELLMAKYPITSIYHQPARERVIRKDIDDTITKLHHATESIRKGNTGHILEREGLFVDKVGEPEFRGEVEEDIRRVIDDYALLHVFKNVNYDDHYGYLVTDLFRKHAS